MLDQSEAALRKALAEKVPDGSYGFRDHLDGDAVTDEDYSVHVTLTKAGDRIDLDFTATDDQAKGAVNFIMDDSVPSFMVGLYLTMDEPGIAMNDGFTRAVDQVKTRKGSLVDPVFPAPLGMRSHTMIRRDRELQQRGGNHH